MGSGLLFHAAGGWKITSQGLALDTPSPTDPDPSYRYTLTEGDFHHLKNSRLTHLHLPPLKIVTIHECDSGEASSAATPHPAATPKDSLAIFQVRGGGRVVAGWSPGTRNGVRAGFPTPSRAL